MWIESRFGYRKTIWEYHCNPQHQQSSRYNSSRMSSSIMVSSALCADVYPHNRGDEFTNYLHRTLNTTNCLVALSEIHFIPYLWTNVRESCNYISIKISGIHYDNKGATPTIHEIICTIETGMYSD